MYVDTLEREKDPNLFTLPSLRNSCTFCYGLQILKFIWRGTQLRYCCSLECYVHFHCVSFWSLKSDMWWTMCDVRCVSCEISHVSCLSFPFLSFCIFPSWTRISSFIRVIHHSSFGVHSSFAIWSSTNYHPITLSLSIFHLSHSIQNTLQIWLHCLQFYSFWLPSS